MAPAARLASARWFGTCPGHRWIAEGRRAYGRAHRGSPMRLQSPELDLGAAEGARRLIRELLREAGQELTGLESGGSEEALHDFRVAVRRLRSLARSFRPVLVGSVRRRHERRLRSIAGATSGARDAEVQLTWLERERARFAARDAAALQWLIGDLEDRRQAGYHRATEELVARFRRLARRLSRSLASEPGSQPGVTLADLLAETIRGQAGELAARLEVVTGPFDVEAAHAARISAKRLRYLLEPLRGCERADSSAAVTILKELQDLLGELHDAHVLGEVVARKLVEAATERARLAHAAVLAGGAGASVLRLARRDPLARGLLALDVRMVERTTSAFSALSPDWLAARRGALDAGVREVSEALRPRPTGGAGPLRRFLLVRLPAGLVGTPAELVETGWFPGPPPRTRLIRSSGPGGVQLARARDPSAPEALSEEAFLALWPETEGLRLTRHRRQAVRSGRRWTVDVVGARGPILAESADPGEVRLPRWLREVVVREVTGERAYVDERLATRREGAQASAPPPAAADAVEAPATAEPLPAPGA
jgi:CHAD domain-containing protein